MLYHVQIIQTWAAHLSDGSLGGPHEAKISWGFINVPKHFDINFITSNESGLKTKDHNVVYSGFILSLIQQIYTKVFDLVGHTRFPRGPHV